MQVQAKTILNFKPTLHPGFDILHIIYYLSYIIYYILYIILYIYSNTILTSLTVQEGYIYVQRSHGLF